MKVELPESVRILITSRRFGTIDESVDLTDFPPDAIAYLVQRGLRECIADGAFIHEQDTAQVIARIKTRRPMA